MHTRVALLPFLGLILLTISHLGLAQSEEVSDTSLEALPVMDSTWWSRIDTLRSEGKYAKLAHWLFTKNQALRASELALFSAGQYARAGKADSAALGISLAIDYGMTTPNLLAKYPELDTVRQSDQWPAVSRRLAQLGERLSRVDNFEIDTEPLSSFWPYFNKALEDTARARELLASYVATGSDAVRDFYVRRYHSPDQMYRRMIRKAPHHYIYTQRVLDPSRLNTIKKEVTDMMNRFAESYPPTVFPKVHIMPGILNTGGTASDLGLYIGGEMFVKTDSMSLDSLSTWQQNAISDFDRMKFVIMHELMHFQQSYQDTAQDNTLLAGVITEGVCDFLVELSYNQTIEPISTDGIEYLSNPDSLQNVLNDFQENMFSDDLSDWMYGNSGKYPTDIGYALGYKICKSYYERSGDKTKALYQLLNTDNFLSILAGSEYNDLVTAQSNDD